MWQQLRLALLDPERHHQERINLVLGRVVEPCMQAQLTPWLDGVEVQSVDACWVGVVLTFGTGASWLAFTAAAVRAVFVQHRYQQLRGGAEPAVQLT
jgi:hypothetical protein